MIKNFFLVAWRNLTRNRVYSVINIGGLSLGMLVAMLIGLWIYDEVAYNKSIKQYDHIVQIMQHQQIDQGIITYGTLPLPTGEVLRKQYGSDFKQVAGTVSFEQFLAYKDKSLRRQGTFTEPALPDILSLEMIAGNRNSLQDPSAILINQTLATALFGDADPLHQTINVGNRFPLQVTGVYRDLPQNSRFGNVDFIAPIAPLVKQGFLFNNWQSTYAEVFAVVNENSRPGILSAKIKKILQDNTDDQANPVLFVHPMRNWHLYEFKNGVRVAGRLQYVWLFGIIGMFILVLAGINFMNLSTARSERRAREVGIRKTVGSLRLQLVYQFFCESFLVVLFSFVIALAGVALSVGWFGKLAGKTTLSLPVQEISFWLAAAGFILFTAILAGSYPALYLSAFKPVQVLKGIFKAGKLAALPRKFLVVLQFSVSVILVVGTLLIYRQIQYAKNRPIGYDRDRLVSLRIESDALMEHYAAFRNDLINDNLAEQVSRSSSTTTGIFSSANNLDWRGKDPNTQSEFGTILVDPGYGNLINWTVTQGRNFSPNMLTDSFGFIFNESAIRLMGLQNPLGETVKWHGKNWHIIGVVKDMVMKSPFDNSMPTVFLMNDKERNFNIIHLKLKAGEAASTSLAKIETVFKKYSPATPFEYQFTDEAYAAKFSGEERIGQLATLFAALAVLISCLGLFGLASFVAEKRTREIGVRKILGASVFNLWKLLSKEFVLLVLIASGIAIIPAYLLLQEWLQQFEYRTTLSGWLFAAAIGGALLVTIFTVSFQAVKAALMNPVKSLRTE